MKRRIALLFSGSFATAVCLFLGISGSAFAATATWTGGGGLDTKVSTAANWGGTAPVNGDDLVIPASSTADLSIDNDVVGLSVNSLSVSGAPTTYHYIDFSNNPIAIGAGGVSVSATGIGANLQLVGVTFSASQTVTVAANNNISLDGALVFGTSNVTINLATASFADLGGIITGSGSLTQTGTGIMSLQIANPAYTGAITSNGGTLIATDVQALGTSAGSTTVNAGADIELFSCGTPSATFAENLILNGVSSLTTGDNPTPKIKAYNYNQCSFGGSGSTENYGQLIGDGAVILSGDITLGSDITVGAAAATITLNGALNGAHALNLVPGYGGKLILNNTPNNSSTPNGSYIPDIFTKTLADVNSGSSVTINSSAVITITGTRGNTDVFGGTLKGTGSVGTLSMSLGVIAPGMSPGCLASGNLSLTGGTFQAELGGTTACSGYDQLTVTGTVSLGANVTTLDVSLYNGFLPAKGNSFTIISNDASDAVTGTFKGLNEAGTFVLGGYTYSISYKGGDGNDVVLTVVGVPPTAPNTGVGSILVSPMLAFSAAFLSASTLIGAVIMSRKR